MAHKFSWNCPYCKRDSTITESNLSKSVHYFDEGNKDGVLGIVTQVTTCPNPACREYQIRAWLYKVVINGGNFEISGDPIMNWNLKPGSAAAKRFPDCVPRPILDVYEEACLIKDLSPRASAALSRKCLQGIIRNYWEVKKKRLVDEINEIQEKTDPITWEAIDSVRRIGNIGAHMEENIGLILDVDPNEAELLIGLIEILFKDWYIAREKRKRHLRKIIDVAGVKEEKEPSRPKRKS